MEIIGNLKNNTLIGLLGPDLENDIYGDAEVLDGLSKVGNDILIGGAFATNHLNGDALTMTNSKGGNDILIGGANANGLLPNDPGNVLCGDSGDISNPTGDMTNSTGGNDILTGGANAFNIVAGDTCNTMVNSTGGNDILTGGANAHNILVGDAQFMTNSTGGNDRLVSGANAKDEMWGDFAHVDGNVTFGSDRFVFGAGSGLDTIHDFQQGKDTIDAGGYGVTSFAQLTIANGVVAFDGAADGAGNEVTVLALGDIPIVLAASDFSFFGA